MSPAVVAAPSAAPYAPPIGPSGIGDARATFVEIVTPEGVPLAFRVAPGGARVAAFVIDGLFVLLWAAAVIGVAVLVGVVGGGVELAVVVALLGGFLLRYGYFTAYEISGRGATPGKRRLHLRVVDASGGPLTAEAVIVRNLAREIELFIPLVALLAPAAIGFSAPPVVRVVASLWAVAFALVPLMNRRRLRVGDLLAGTMVIEVPWAVLLADVGGRPTASEAAEAAPRFHFTDAQLDVYGEYELRVLEDVLRRRANATTSSGTLAGVAQRIAKKIAWATPVSSRDETEFLRAYYAALRARLEHRMLLGRRKADKRSR
jgi:uncharacterized RDD family membrane protein YckC